MPKNISCGKTSSKRKYENAACNLAWNLVFIYYFYVFLFNNITVPLRIRTLQTKRTIFAQMKMSRSLILFNGSNYSRLNLFYSIYFIKILKQILLYISFVDEWNNEQFRLVYMYIEYDLFCWLTVTVFIGMAATYLIHSVYVYSMFYETKCIFFVYFQTLCMLIPKIISLFLSAE